MNSADILTKRANLTPDREALFDLTTGVRYTYAELNKRANRAANLLQGKYGVQKGDRVSPPGCRWRFHLSELRGHWTEKTAGAALQEWIEEIWMLTY